MRSWNVCCHRLKQSYRFLVGTEQQINETMATVINLYPYDPGSEETHRKLHGCKSYIFWPPVHDTISEDSDKKRAEIVDNGKSALLALGPRSVASVYLIVQLVLHYFLQWLRRVAVTVKIIYPSHRHHELLGDQHRNHQVSAAPFKLDHSTTTKDKQDSSLITSTTTAATSRCGVDAVAVEKKRLLLVRSNINDLKIDRSAVRELRFDFAGYFEKFEIDKFCLSTKFSTAIFEVSNGGLQYLIKDLKSEFREYCSDVPAITGSGSVVACCDVVWSIPSKYRSYWTELFLTNEIDNVMRVNNQRVYDVLFADDHGLSRASKGGIVQRTETTDKTVDASIGVYRHFYPELVKLAHKQAEREHEDVWNFDAELSNVKMDWPLANDLSKTTVVAVNLIVLKF